MGILSSQGLTNPTLLALEPLKTFKNLTHFEFKLSEYLELNNAGFLNLVEVIKNQSHLSHLHLHLTGTWDTSATLSDAAFKSLATMTTEFPLLDLELNFSCINSMSNTAIAGLSKLFQCKRLKRLFLDFSECPKVTDDGIAVIGNTIIKLPELTQFSLNLACKEMYASKITSSSLQKLSVGLNKCLELKELNLNFTNCSKILDDGFAILSKCLKPLINLNHLTLKFIGCEKVTSMEELSITLRNLSNLHLLNLNFSQCPLITNDAASKLVGSLVGKPQMNQLALSFPACVKLNENGFTHLSEGINTMRGLSLLDLNFGSWPEMRIIPLKGSNDPQLNEIRLCAAMCRNVENEGIKNFAEYLNHQKKLITLNLNFHFCEKLTNDGISTLAGSFSKLSQLTNLELNFSDCKGITDNCLTSFRDNIGKLHHLRKFTLFLSNCIQISDTGVSYIAKTLQELSILTHLSLKMDHCDKISTVGLQDLFAKFPKLKLLRNLYLSLEGCNLSPMKLLDNSERT
jgi:hypothetical protein